MANYCIKDINEISRQNLKDKSFNILLDDCEYTYVKGLIHVDFEASKAILFTDIDYDDIKYDIKWTISDILYNFNFPYIDNSNIHALHIPSIISKLKYDEEYLYNIDPILEKKIGINFKTFGFDVIYKIGHQTNIIETIRNINVSTVKEQLINSLMSLISNIKSFRTNELTDVMHSEFSNITLGELVNLRTHNIEFLNYIKNNSKVINTAYENLDDFKGVTSSYLTSYCKQTADKTFNIRVTNNFSIQTHYNIKQYSNRHSLIFKFNDIKIIVSPYSWNSTSQHIFVISYLMYLNEYDKLMAYFRNKILQVM